jgi:hypothetical protein
MMPHHLAETEEGGAGRGHGPPPISGKKKVYWLKKRKLKKKIMFRPLAPSQF